LLQPVYIDRVLVGVQMHRGRFVGTQVQPLPDTLCYPALIAEAVLNDTHPQARDVNAFRQLCHARQS
jgi:hypothetical protein